MHCFCSAGVVAGIYVDHRSMVTVASVVTLFPCLFPPLRDGAPYKLCRNSIESVLLFRMAMANTPCPLTGRKSICIFLYDSHLLFWLRRFSWPPHIIIGPLSDLYPSFLEVPFVPHRLRRIPRDFNCWGMHLSLAVWPSSKGRGVSSDSIVSLPSY